MDRLQSILDYTVAGISIVRWILIAAVILGTVVLLGAIKRLILRKLSQWSERERLQWLNYVEAVFGKSKLFLYLGIGLFAGLKAFDVDPEMAEMGHTAVRILIIIQIGVWISAGLSALLERYSQEVEDDAAKLTALSAADFLSAVVVWALALLMILDNLGFDITALIASLGIGGAAIALASQKLLGDLFAFFSILVDKPFVHGDFVIVGDFMGSIEHIGIKSTRIRSLDGEQLVITNEDLLQSRIRNFKRMRERRVVVEFGVTYHTPTETLRSIPDRIADFLGDEPQVRFDRAHLAEFGESSLRYEIVYWVQDPAFEVHMDIQQELLLKLIDELRDRDVDFAFPTRIVHIDDSKPVPEAATTG